MNSVEESEGTKKEVNDSTEKDKKLTPKDYVSQSTVNYRLKKWLESKNEIKKSTKNDNELIPGDESDGS